MADNLRHSIMNTASSTVFLTPKISHAQGVGGGGDSDTVLGAGRQNKPRFRRFGNGVRIPVFYETSEPEDGMDINANPASTGSPPVWDGKFPDLSSSEATDLMELFKCTICQDYMVEATAASCGHTFCCGCLTSWTKLKPICPICSKRVTCRIRLYNEDLLIERMINRCEDFPQEIARNLYEASKCRMDKQEHCRSSLLGRIRGKMDLITNSLYCKGVWQCFKDSGPIQAMVNYWNGYQAGPEVADAENRPLQMPAMGRGVKFYFMAGILLGALLMWGYNQSWGFAGVEVTFFRYLYLCVTHYDGSIPAFLLKSSPDQDVEVGELESKPWYSKMF